MVEYVTTPIELLREKRNRLLQESDWTQVSDVVLSNLDEWRTYRQALRDITIKSSPRFSASINVLEGVEMPIKPTDTEAITIYIYSDGTPLVFLLDA